MLLPSLSARPTKSAVWASLNGHLSEFRYLVVHSMWSTILQSKKGHGCITKTACNKWSRLFLCRIQCCTWVQHSSGSNVCGPQANLCIRPDVPCLVVVPGNKRYQIGPLCMVGSQPEPGTPPTAPDQHILVPPCTYSWRKFQPLLSSIFDRFTPSSSVSPPPPRSTLAMASSVYLLVASTVACIFCAIWWWRSYPIATASSLGIPLVEFGDGDESKTRYASETGKLLREGYERVRSVSHTVLSCSIMKLQILTSAHSISKMDNHFVSTIKPISVARSSSFP